jgi:alpha-maltose-1-phosphate synthase
MGVSAPPRVAVVYPTPFGDAGLYGGGERYAVELARALSRRAPTRLVTFGERPGRRVEAGLETRTYRPLLYLRGARNNPLSLRFLAALADVDVIHCVCWNTLPTDLAVLAGRALGKGVFVTDVGGGASLTLQRFLPVGELVDRYLLIAAQGGGSFARYRSRWSILYAGVDLERYRPDPERRRRGVLFVGRLLPHKGIDTLLAAVGPEVPLRIVGRPYHAGYFALLQRLAQGKDVTFVTDASDADVVREYQSCAVAVLPSVYDTVYGDHTDLPELLGFTAMEAMACGAPTICTAVGGLPEVAVDGETGYLVPPSDPQTLGDRIARILANPELAARLGAAARRRMAAEFTWDRVADRCFAAYAAARSEGGL